MTFANVPSVVSGEDTVIPLLLLEMSCRIETGVVLSSFISFQMVKVQIVAPKISARSPASGGAALEVPRGRARRAE